MLGLLDGACVIGFAIGLFAFGGGLGGGFFVGASVGNVEGGFVGRRVGCGVDKGSNGIDIVTALGVYKPLDGDSGGSGAIVALEEGRIGILA